MSRQSYSKYINTFIFRRTWAELICLLSDEDAGKLIKAIFTHTKGESAGEYLTAIDGEHLKPAASAIISAIERNAQHFLVKRNELPQIMAAAPGKEVTTDEQDP